MEKNHLKKYRLIREYPGSPKLGTIAEKFGNDSIKFSNGVMLSSAIIGYFDKIITNNPKYWEEIVEKDYEILEYRNNSILKKIKNYKDYIKLINYSKQFWHIYKVKRLSDGKIFTVGDKVLLLGYNTPNTIKDFSLTDNILYVNGVRLSSVKIYKKPLFTTEDGVDIFKGNKYFTVGIKNVKHLFKIVGPYVNPKATEPTGDILYFSTKEAAEEYILMNKPCLSINDLLNRGFAFVDLKYLTKLVKSKL